MSALPSKRQFLNSVTNPATGMPYAGLTRGRFSAEAEALAAANTDKWAEAPVVVKVPKAPKPAAAPKAPGVSLAKAPASVATGNVNPKEVRAWAKQNGHEVGERGRIHGSVVQAFLAAGGKATVPSAPRPTPLLMPKVRRESTGFTVVGGTLIRQDKCGNGHAVSRCNCPDGVPAYKWLAKEHGAPLMLTLDKPAL
jgi:hypothetical protein